MTTEDIKICVIGLGYVGLPLARLFSTKYKTIGFDMNQKRVDALMQGHDATLEISDDLLQAALNNGFKCTTNLDDIKQCNFYIIAVPTPVDENNHPDLRPLWGASETVGKVISKDDIVVYESTVYPGVTEEECLAIIYNTVSDWINRYTIDTIGLEKTIYVQNHQTAIKLGMVRGVILLAIKNALKDITLYQYSPKEGKRAVLYGGATKAQVKKMVQALFKVTPRNEDESDALSLAYAAAQDKRVQLMLKKQKTCKTTLHNYTTQERSYR